MLISHRYRFIFLKTRKTASTSVEGILERLCAPDGHIPKHKQSEIRSEYGYISGRAGGETRSDFLQAHSPASVAKSVIGAPIFNSYLKVYTVRNPYDKVVSWFWHVMPLDMKNHVDADFESARRLFRGWLRMRPVLPIDTQYYRTEEGHFDSEIIRYENLKYDLECFASQIGAPLDTSELPHWKTQKRGHKLQAFQNYYDEDTRDIVKRRFSYDFENFGYPV